MGTATSRARALASLLLTLVLAGCGASGAASTSSSSRSAVTSGSHASSQAAFAWLAPQAPPAGWQIARIPSGAVMYYPPNWQREHGDRGTATAVVLESGDHIRGYLNLTPRQGDESSATWAAFRIHHNADEGDRDDVREASARGLDFRSGTGSCVRDRYTTITGAHYVELACLVVGQKTSSVIVAAATPQAWAELSPLLERAISAFTA